MKHLIALMIVAAPLMSQAYSENDRVSLEQKASAIAQLAESNNSYVVLKASTRAVLTALVSGQKDLSRQGITAKVLTHSCASGTGESTCTLEVSIRKDGQSEGSVITIEYAISGGVVAGASETQM